MDYCKKCKNFGCNAAGTERTTTNCEDYMSHLPTNGDRIRAMSDEELAEWIYQVQDGDAYQKENYLPPLSKSWWIKWLKQESENES